LGVRQEIAARGGPTASEGSRHGRGNQINGRSDGDQRR
jgi:hypothetical protein